MKYPDEKTEPRLVFDAHQCKLSEADRERMKMALSSLGRQVEHFPVSDVHVLVEHNARSNDYSVKITLVLPGTTLVGNDHDAQLHLAFDRCLIGLEENVRAYKDRLGQVPERQKQEKGTHQEVQPDHLPDQAPIDAAVAADDYAAFRAATVAYEEPVRKRVGRWLERYPGVNARIGKGLEVADVVEEVFLDAFEGYAGRPKEARFGDWLGSLIDRAVRELNGAHRDETLENVRLVRTAREAEQGEAAVG
jgi:ribosome-associated translation inhibitor RaiA